MNPPSPLSRPGSSADPASQFSDSQDSVGQILVVTVASKPKVKRKASRADLPERTGQRNSITAAKENLAQSIAPASEAISEEAAALRKISKRTKEYKERAPETHNARTSFRTWSRRPRGNQRSVRRLIRGVGGAEHLWRKARALMCGDRCIKPGERDFYFQLHDVNQRQGASAGEEMFRKNRPVTAGIHWKNMRRWLGIMKLAPSKDHPLSIRDMLTEDEEKNMFEHLEMVKNARGKKYIPAATHVNSRMWSSVGCVFLDSGDVAR